MPKDKVEDVKRQILSRLNILQELQLMGIETVGDVSLGGWIACKHPFRRDNNPSCGACVDSTDERAGYICAFNEPGDKKPYATYNFFDLAAAMNSNFANDFWKALYHYADKAGVKVNQGGKKKSKKPTIEDVERYHRQLVPTAREYLRTKRGLTDETIDKAKIGWYPKDERNTIPILDSEGDVQNIKFHNSKKNPKTYGIGGFGSPRLYNIRDLKREPAGSTVVVLEGEFDALLCRQETGLCSVSGTNGADNWISGWVKHFYGYQVVICFDSDGPGRDGVNKRVIKTFRPAVMRGEIPSVKIVWLYDKPDKNRKDFTDWIVKDGGTGDRFKKLIEDTPEYQFDEPEATLDEPTQIPSLVNIDYGENFGKRVMTNIVIHGENTEAYSTITKVHVTHCKLMEQGKCSGRDDWEFLCTEPVPIPDGSRLQLAATSFSDTQLTGAIRQHICDKGQAPAIKLIETERRPMREVYAHQVLEDGAARATDLIEKPVYILSGEQYPIGQYRVTGTVQSHPRHQKPTLVVDQISAEESCWQSFRINNDTWKNLEAIRRVEISDLVHDIASGVTRIFDREEIHLATLLSMVSPLYIDTPHDGRIRGRVIPVIIGDSGTGKTEVSKRLHEYTGVGYRLSGATASRTGITYACENDEKRGWRIKAGAMLKMTRQLLIIDEAQDIETSDLKTMAEAFDSGVLRVDRIQNRIFESETRCIFVCNPRSQDRASDQRTMDSFLYPCEALKDIFDKMMIRRMDLFVFVANFDVDVDKAISDIGPMTKPTIATRENLQALVYYAWNLTPERIKITPKIADLANRTAQALSQTYGSADDLPIVHPADFRKTFLRLATSIAILDLSTTDDYQTITLLEDHIELMEDIIHQIYGNSDNCRLKQYAHKYRSQRLVSEEEFEEIHATLKTHMDHGTDRNRVCRMIQEIMSIDMGRDRKISQKYLSDQHEATRMTIYRDLLPFVQNKLIESTRGYCPTRRLIQFNNWLERNDPNFFIAKDS